MNKDNRHTVVRPLADAIVFEVAAEAARPIEELTVSVELTNQRLAVSI